MKWLNHVFPSTCLWSLYYSIIRWFVHWENSIKDIKESPLFWKRYYLPVLFGPNSPNCCIHNPSSWCIFSSLWSHHHARYQMILWHQETEDCMKVYFYFNLFTSVDWACVHKKVEYAMPLSQGYWWYCSFAGHHEVLGHHQVSTRLLFVLSL